MIFKKVERIGSKVSLMVIEDVTDFVNTFSSSYMAPDSSIVPVAMNSLQHDNHVMDLGKMMIPPIKQ